ncbi:MAG: peptidylprolyl isomerase [Planctomycetes bacterium]|nr:peptidylprolyl isomerase [Planctomycetota bacterium]
MSLLATVAVAFIMQDPGEVLARYRLDGRPAAVTRTDVAVEMAFQLRRDELGRNLCEVLVDSTLTRMQAENLELMPSEAEVRRFWEQLQQQLRAAGRDPRDFPAMRNSTEPELLRDLAVQLAQERLVRHALDLPADEAVSGEMLRLWIAERRKKATIVTDPELLPTGTAARVDGREISMTELGSLILRTSEDDDRDSFVRKVIYLTSIEHLAQQHDIELDQAQLDAAVALRRQEAVGNPRFRGLSFDQLLQTQGMTVASLVQSRVFRAKLLQERLADIRYPDAKLRAELEADRPATCELVGARRRLGVIYRRAIDEPNALVPHDFDSAAESLRRVRERLEIERFDVVARIETDDPRGKELGGDMGWLHRRNQLLPEPVLAVAFDAGDGSLLGPVRAKDGCYLVKVLEIEPEPSDDVLVQRLRELRMQEMTQQIMTDAAIEWGNGETGAVKR